MSQYRRDALMANEAYGSVYPGQNNTLLMSVIHSLTHKHVYNIYSTLIVFCVLHLFSIKLNEMFICHLYCFRRYVMITMMLLIIPKIPLSGFNVCISYGCVKHCFQITSIRFAFVRFLYAFLCLSADRL